MKVDVTTLADRLDEARANRAPIQPLRNAGLDNPHIAYEIQQAWIKRLLERGDTVVGRKIGLTSRVMQEQMGVSEPDFGTLLAGWQLSVHPGTTTATIDVTQFIAPRVEGEIAFLLAEPLTGPGVTVVDVFRATQAVAAAVEIIDSRIRDWDIALVDTVADNASCGAFAIGHWTTRWQALDLALAGMVLYVDGAVAATGAGAAALGHPATCVAWLANKLAELGEGLKAGDVILSGSLGGSLPVSAGNNVRLHIAGLEPVHVQFT